MGADVQVHDLYVKHWWELEKQDTYPDPGHSWSRFFRNQESLSDIRISKDLKTSLKGVAAVILLHRWLRSQRSGAWAHEKAERRGCRKIVEKNALMI